MKALHCESNLYYPHTLKCVTWQNRISIDTVARMIVGSKPHNALASAGFQNKHNYPPRPDLGL